MDKTISVQELADFLEQLLSKKPSKTGQRLCSERDLGEKLNIDRMKVQKAFGLLMEKGIITRRIGSGTYIRKVPKRSGSSQQILWNGDTPVKVEALFAKPSPVPARHQINQEHRSLKLALLPTWESESNNSILGGIKDRVRREGHEIKTYRIKQATKEDVPPHTIPPDPKLVAKLKEERFDGYILWARYVPVMEQAFPGQSPPCVYIGSGSRDEDLNSAPLVRIDLEDAAVRGLKLLAKEGYEKIGMIRYSSMSRDVVEDERLYHEVLDRFGLSYRNVASCKLKTANAQNIVKKMFLGKDRPQAVFVDDDVLLHYLAAEWANQGITPGKDLAVITISNRGNALPAGWDWSRLEFHPEQVGRMAVDCLLQEIQTAGEELCSFEHLSVWRPGATHQIQKICNGLSLSLKARK